MAIRVARSTLLLFVAGVFEVGAGEAGQNEAASCEKDTVVVPGLNVDTDIQQLQLTRPPNTDPGHEVLHTGNEFHVEESSMLDILEANGFALDAGDFGTTAHKYKRVEQEGGEVEWPSAKRKHRQHKAPGGRVERPTEAGCWFRTANGCPNHPGLETNKAMNGTLLPEALWQRDTLWEVSANALVQYSKDNCVDARAEKVSAWCGAQVEYEYVTMRTAAYDTHPWVERPQVAGCLLFMNNHGQQEPRGCPNHPMFSWLTFDKETCEQNDRFFFRDWCGSDDFTLHMTTRQDCYLAGRYTGAGDADCGFNASLELEQDQEPARYSKMRHRWKPSKPGCFMKAQSGCPLQPEYNWTGWVGKVREVGVDERTCKETRREKFEEWCGATGVQALHNPPRAGFAQLRRAANFAASAFGLAAEWERVKDEPPVGVQKAATLTDANSRNPEGSESV